MKILKKDTLADAQGVKITEIKVSAPDIAKKALAGQFVVLMAGQTGERIPLTVVMADKTEGSITLIFQETGLTTRLLGKLNQGDSLYSLAGPLGHATVVRKYGSVIIIGGGVGIAEVFPVAKALKEAGNKIITILGARSKNILILEKELKAVSDEIHITTDDGSYGRKGFVTDVLKDAITQTPPPGWGGIVYAVGPIPMMKAVSDATKAAGVKTIVSLNALMVDATGMCGCCRVTVGGQVKFSCVDGPEFDAHSVDWDELKNRNCMYQDKEKHACKLNS